MRFGVWGTPAVDAATDWKHYITHSLKCTIRSTVTGIWGQTHTRQLPLKHTLVPHWDISTLHFDNQYTQLSLAKLHAP